MTYLWHQTLGGGAGNHIDPAAVPADRIALARAAIEQSIAAAGEVAIPQRRGIRLRASAEGRRLLVTLFSAIGAPIVTMGVAPRDRDGAKLWPMLVEAAQDQGVRAPLRRPQEPWAVVVAHFAGVQALAASDDLDWLLPLEAELGVAWLEMTRG